MNIPQNLYRKIFQYVPVLAVDGVVYQNRKILLGKRIIDPFKGFWCLPGGRMDIDETCEEAVERELKEETGLDCQIVKLLGVYSQPNRDPRGHTVSVGYLLKPIGGKLKTNFEAGELKYFPIKDIPHRLGFDHQTIINDALSVISH